MSDPFAHIGDSLRDHELIITPAEAKEMYEKVENQDPALAEEIARQVDEAIAEKKSASEIIGLVMAGVKTITGFVL